MSRQSHLPPRCPFQKKPTVHPVYDTVSPSFPKGIASHSRHHKSVSQSYVKEEQPAWLDDLLSETDSNSSSMVHRRSASDSLTLLDDLASLSILDNVKTRDTSDSCENDGRLNLPSIYGPNSPRGKGNPTFSESGLVSALSSYVLHKDSHDLEENFSASRVAVVKLAENAWGSNSELMDDTKSMKRHPGQRSRVRKLQYIADLERTVDMLQQTESDLAARVASLLQQRLSLSMENIKLKQKLVILQQRRLTADRENKTLNREFEMLKLNMVCGGEKGGSKTGLGISSRIGSCDTTWQCWT